jgi:hypothetical protein
VSSVADDYRHSRQQPFQSIELVFRNSTIRRYVACDSALGICRNEMRIVGRGSGLRRSSDSQTRRPPISIPQPPRLKDMKQFVVCDPLDGIIVYLTRQCHGIVHDRRRASITSSRVFNNRDQAKKATDLKSDSPFWPVAGYSNGRRSRDGQDNWL